VRIISLFHSACMFVKDQGTSLVAFRGGVRTSLFILQPQIGWAWGGVVVKALRYKSGGLGIEPQWCHWGIFPRLTTEPCALGLTQPLNMSTRKIPGSKAGRCVRPTTYHLLVPNVKKIRGLNLPDLPWACSDL
jgi:hypothetical protein